MGQEEFDLLIIEDDESILRLLADLFSDFSLRLETAGCIAQARSILARRAFKVVLSDHNLPDGNGVDFLAELPGAGIKSVPILMTGVPDLSVAVEAINRGKVHKFVTKPLDFMALQQTILRAIEVHGAQRERERMTREILEHNDRLLREAEARERSLRVAADRIRLEEEKVARQKVHIEDLYSEIQGAYLHTVTSLTLAIEAKDRYTKGHSERVYHYCLLMAEVLGLNDESRHDLRFASVLHDLGKIGIPDSILLKPTPLSSDEWQVMASHPGMTDEILRPLPFLENVRKIIREHHERFDGKGYPAGLKGDEISLEGRVLAVADAYDAMRTDRAYRSALRQETAIQELKNGTGAQFCPLCVGALLYGLKSRGEPDNALPTSAQPVLVEEGMTGIRPASKTIHVETLLN